MWSKIYSGAFASLSAATPARSRTGIRMMAVDAAARDGVGSRPMSALLTVLDLVIAITAIGFILVAIGWLR